MSDFEDLLQIREAKEKAEESARQEALQEDQRSAEIARRVDERKTSHAQSLDDTVLGVLEDLRKAVYPGLLITPRSGPGGCAVYAHWAIIRELWDEGMYHSDAVSVQLKYNEKGDPLYFVVSRETVVIEDIVPIQRSFMSRLFSGRDENRHLIKSTEVQFEPVTCGLTRQELTSALKKLHPPNTIGARPRRGW